MNDIEIYKSDVVQALLDHLPQPTLSTPWSLSFKIAKQFTEKDKHIIAGYASVEVIDSQNELIPIPVLKDAWVDFRKNKDFYFGSLMHSNIPVIKILDKYKDSAGQEWKSGVDENGLFIVAEVRGDIQKGVQTWELIEKGELTGFSIGGEALASSTVCEGKCYTRVEKMEIHEIAVVDRPANQPSVFKILKSDTLRKLAEITDELPNLIISPSVAVLAGSTAELGKGHDFDVLVRAEKGSFVARAIETRIHNELRKKERLDLWDSIQFIYEPEGLGPFTDYYPLFDLVLLRSPLEKKSMLMKAKGTKERLMEEYELNEGQAKLLITFIGEANAKKLLPESEKVKKAEYCACPIDQTINKESWSKFNKALELLSPSMGWIIKKSSLSNLDKALCLLERHNQ